MSEDGRDGVQSTRRSTRPSRMKAVDTTMLSMYLGISLSPSNSSSSDEEFHPKNARNASGSGNSSSGSSSSSGSTSSSSSDDCSSDESGSPMSCDPCGTAEEGKEEVGNCEMEEGDSTESTLPNGAPVTYFPVEFAMKKEAKAEENPLLCCVCLEPASSDGDIVTCDLCGISVHEGCYGVPEQEAEDDTRSDISSFSTVPWFCDVCRSGETNVSCELCPNEEGLFKQTLNGRWVHIICCLYVPGVEYVEPQILSGVNLDHIPPNRWGFKPCQLCTDEWLSLTGVCIGCDAGLCKAFFHATCAQREGLLCEAEEDSDDSDKDIADPYYAHCLVHSNRDLARAKKKDYLRVIAAQKRNSHVSPDERMKAHLQVAETDYSALFDRMRGWYRPEDASVKQERFLHHCPPAFKALTKKAELLGHDVQPAPQLGRKYFGRVPVGLTTRFVEYFNERDKRLSQMKKEETVLSTTRSQLEEQQKELNKKFTELTNMLSLLETTGKRLRETMGGICQALNSVTNDEVCTAEQLLNDTEREGTPPKPEKPTTACCVCDRCHDNHLMVQCDTCSKFYHIGCLEPPLLRVPKKTSCYGWQCEDCCCDSEDELKVIQTKNDGPRSRSGRRLHKTAKTNRDLEQDSPKRKRKRK